MQWLYLIRWKNLIIVFFTQLIIWRYVFLPDKLIAFPPPHFASVLLNFICLSVSTLFIAAAGYIINDYFDIRIDTINKPNKIVLGKKISRKMAIVVHFILNTVAMCLAFILANQFAHMEWILLQFVCVVLLWFYSTHFKRWYITGNFVVALLTAFTIVILLLYAPAITLSNEVVKFQITEMSKWFLVFYSYFAFMMTWMREIVKDMEDHKGDDEDGCRTVPVVKGLEYSAKFTVAIGASVVLPLLFSALYLFFLHYFILALYVIFILVLPLVGWFRFLYHNFSTTHYGRASRYLKIIMILGIFSIIIYHYENLNFH